MAKKYQKPEVRVLNSIPLTHGLCVSGGGDSGNCTSGDVAGSGCGAGSGAGTCGTGAGASG